MTAVHEGITHVGRFGSSPSVLGIDSVPRRGTVEIVRIDDAFFEEA